MRARWYRRCHSGGSWRRRRCMVSCWALSAARAKASRWAGSRSARSRRGLATLTRVRCSLLGNLLNHGIVLFDAALHELRLYFGFLSSEQVDFSLERPVARQFDLNAMRSGRDHQRMKLAA